MATQRITIDVGQHFKSEDLQSINEDIYSYIWGFIQNKYDASDDRSEVTVGQHQHDATDGACPRCVQLATDDKN
jgi:hypothetical protein